VGVDIVLTARVRTLLADHGEPVLARMLTAAELADCRKRECLDLLSVAGRIAAKEAAFKTLATSGVPLPWLGLEVRTAPGGRPVLHLDAPVRALADRANVSAIRISISHDGEYAVGMAVAVLRQGPPLSDPQPRKPQEVHHADAPPAGQGLDPQAPPGA
jgi:holo-[acyl-carrier protein] synthase